MMNLLAAIGALHFKTGLSWSKAMIQSRETCHYGNETRMYWTRPLSSEDMHTRQV